MEERLIPRFKTEAEEAQWWYDNRDELAKDFLKAVEEGRITPGARLRLRYRLGPETKE